MKLPLVCVEGLFGFGFIAETANGSETISMTCNRNTTAAAHVTWWTGYSGSAAI